MLRYPRGEFAYEVETGHVRHQVIDDQHVVRLPADQPVGFPRARRLDHVMPFLAQGSTEGATDLDLIVDQQDRAVGHGPTTSADAPRGSSICISVPSST